MTVEELLVQLRDVNPTLPVWFEGYDQFQPVHWITVGKVDQDHPKADPPVDDVCLLSS